MTYGGSIPSEQPTGRLHGLFAGCQIGQPIGGGGMAMVYEAREIATGARVALKLVLRQAGRDAELILEAEREGAILQEHLAAADPRVARIYRYGEEGDYFFVQMELVEGQDLSRLLEGGPVSAAEAVRIAIEVGEVLRSAHALTGRIDGGEFRGVVHGDIKPRNVRLTPDGRVKVLDFGIAKALSLSRRLTRNEFGSLHYASPERLESGTVDERSDLWSLGVVLYEMLAGRLPFKAETEEKLERMIRDRRPAPPLAGCAPSLRRIVDKALAPFAEQRYPDAASILSDLTAFSEGRAAGMDERADDTPTQRVALFPVSDAVLVEGELPGPEGADFAARQVTTESASTDGNATRRTSLRSVDTDATRRTHPPASFTDADATRRTAAASAEPGRRTVEEETGPRIAGASSAARTAHAAPATAASISAPDALERRRRTVRLAVRLAAGFVLLWLSLALFGQWRILSRSRALATDVAAARVAREEAFEEHKTLAGNAWTSLLVQPLRRELLASYRSVADAVIDEYRSSDSPLVRERDWRRASAAVGSALELSPRDSKLKARRELIEGHLLRIDLRGRRPDPAGAQQAIRRFQSAARIDKWVDPYLGLAALHAYVQHDVEQTDAAVEKITELGVEPGRRERAERADARLLSASDLWADRASLAKLPEESQYLQKIRARLSEAIDLYGTVLGFENTHANLRKARRMIERVDERLAVLEAERKRRQNPLRWLFPFGSDDDEPASKGA